MTGGLCHGEAHPALIGRVMLPAAVLGRLLFVHLFGLCSCQVNNHEDRRWLHSSICTCSASHMSQFSFPLFVVLLFGLQLCLLWQWQTIRRSTTTSSACSGTLHTLELAQHCHFNFLPCLICRGMASRRAASYLRPASVRVQHANVVLSSTLFSFRLCDRHDFSCDSHGDSARAAPRIPEPLHSRRLNANTLIKQRELCRGTSAAKSWLRQRFPTTTFESTRWRSLNRLPRWARLSAAGVARTRRSARLP